MVTRKRRQSKEKIVHNGKVAYQFKKLIDEELQYPADILNSPIKNLAAQWNRWGEEYDMLSKYKYKEVNSDEKVIK